MPVRLGKSVFTHIPKTGGTWIMEVLRELGLARAEFVGHATLTAIQANPEFKEWHGLPGFVFVRHPVSWYQSYWVFKMKTGWFAEPDSFAMECADGDFNGFIHKCVERRPGYLGSLYREFIRGAAFVGRYEILKESLIWILASLGERFDPAIVYSLPPMNVADARVRERLARYTSDSLLALLDSEAEAVKTYGYDMRTDT